MDEQNHENIDLAVFLGRMRRHADRYIQEFELAAEKLYLRENPTKGCVAKTQTEGR
jgi:hypothetical protein